MQSMLNLRQVLEAGAAAAFAIANPEMHRFVDIDPSGFLDPSKDLAQKRYRWLDLYFPDGSKAIKGKKELINRIMSHANIVTANQTFSVDDTQKNIAAPFFDIEDEYHVQVDLWLISSIGVDLMALLHEVNQTRNAIEFTENFPAYLHHAARQSDAPYTRKSRRQIDTNAPWRSLSGYRSAQTRRVMTEPRRFPPPLSVEETAPCFIVRDVNGQALVFVYCEDEPGRRARRTYRRLKRRRDVRNQQRERARQLSGPLLAVPRLRLALSIGTITNCPRSVGTASTVGLRPVARCWLELLCSGFERVCPLADAATSP